ncbi:hypothetical protein K8I31_13625, partial [bacterium]|nr:hypothetical protein [bacterium]
PSLYRGVPRPLQYTISDMGLTLDRPRYYCLKFFIDTEWLWQARLSEKDVNALAEEMRMRPFESDQIADSYRSMPPYWWRPLISNQTLAFATANFPMEGRGADGRHALATWNPKDGVLYMWIKDNF